MPGIQQTAGGMRFRCAMLLAAGTALLMGASAAKAGWWGGDGAYRAQSEGTAYIGIQFSHFDLEESYRDLDRGYSFSPTGVTGRLGYFIVDQLALELRHGRDVSDDRDTVAGDVADGKVSRLTGAYAKGHLPFHLPFQPGWSVYGIVGYTEARSRVDVDREGEGSRSATDADFSYGLGLELSASARHGLSLEYMAYTPSASDHDIRAVSLSATYGW